MTHTPMLVRDLIGASAEQCTARSDTPVMPKVDPAAGPLGIVRSCTDPVPMPPDRGVQEQTLDRCPRPDPAMNRKLGATGVPHNSTEVRA